MTVHTYALMLFVALLLGQAHSYPSHWADRKGNDCTAIPATAFDLQGAPHAVPIIDSNITIAVLSATDGLPVTALCQGGVYNLQVSLPPGQGHHLLVSTYGAFASNVCSNNNACKNRACNCDQPGHSCPLDDTTVTNQITMPCDSSIADGTSNLLTVVYMLTSEVMASKPLRTNTLTMAINTAGCPACTPPPPPEQQSITVKALPKNIKIGGTSTLTATIKGVSAPTGSSSHLRSVLTCQSHWIQYPSIESMPTGGFVAGSETKHAKVTVTSQPQGAVKCAPLTPEITSNNQAVVTCKAVKKGRAKVTVTCDQIREPGGGNKATLRVT